MRQIKKLDEGVRLRIESEDDLWVLAQLCRPQSTLGMLSHRRDSTTGTKEDGRAKNAERKPMWIVLETEKTEFQAFTDNLRAHGIIVDANFDIGLHHTHIISPGDEIELSFPGGLVNSDLILLKETIKSGSKAALTNIHAHHLGKFGADSRAMLAKVGNITQSWQDAIYNRAG